MSNLSDKTLIPIGIAIIVIGGGAAWMTNVHAQISSHEEKLASVQKLQEDISSQLKAIHGEQIELRTYLKRSHCK